jgi:hypothetical protein
VAASIGTDQFMVALTAETNTGYAPPIRAVTVAGGGATSGAFYVRNVANGRWSPSIVFGSSAGEYLVLWADGYFATEPDIMAQRIRPGSPAGLMGDVILLCASRKGQELVIATAGVLNGEPAVAYDRAQNEYWVVWQDIQTPDAGYDIFGPRVNAAGQLVGNALLISRDTQTISEGPADVACNPSTGECLVTWHAWNVTSWDVYYQRLAHAGALLGHDLTYHALRNEYLVVWTDSADGALRGRRLNATAAVPADAFVISAGPSNQAHPALAYDSHSAEYLALWEDRYESNDWDIYGGRVSGVGAPLQPQGALAKPQRAHSPPPACRWGGRPGCTCQSSHNSTIFKVERME